MGPIVESLESRFSQRISKCKGHQHSGSQMLISISALETSGWPGESQVLCLQDILRAPRARGLWEAKSQTQIPQSTWKLRKQYPMKVNRSLFKEEEKMAMCLSLKGWHVTEWWELRHEAAFHCKSLQLGPVSQDSGKQTIQPGKVEPRRTEHAERGAQWENVCLGGEAPAGCRFQNFKRKAFVKLRKGEGRGGGSIAFLLQPVDRPGRPCVQWNKSPTVQ